MGSDGHLAGLERGSPAGSARLYAGLSPLVYRPMLVPCGRGPRPGPRTRAACNQSCEREPHELPFLCPTPTQITGAGLIKRALFNWGYNRKLYFMKNGYPQAKVGKG